MLDERIQRGLKPAMTRMARSAIRMGLTADTVTWLGFAAGLAAASAIALGWFLCGMGLLLFSRLMDGLDGAVARVTSPTDRGGFLDITFDFVFYAAIPLAFAVADPPNNGLPAAVLLASFIGTGSSFLAFAIAAEKRHLSSTAFPGKSFYFLGGLTEATETISVFVLMCLLPQHFAILAYGFAFMCAITTAMRIWWGWKRLS